LWHVANLDGVPRPPPLVRIAWYDAAQWAKLRQTAADAANLYESHETWQRHAE
jgi:hypothetical protein